MRLFKILPEPKLFITDMGLISSGERNCRALRTTRVRMSAGATTLYQRSIRQSHDQAFRKARDQEHRLLDYRCRREQSRANLHGGVRRC